MNIPLHNIKNLIQSLGEISEKYTKFTTINIIILEINMRTEMPIGIYILLTNFNNVTFEVSIIKVLIFLYF